MRRPEKRPEGWETTTALLVALRDGDEPWAWSALVERVTRPALSFVRRRGLTDVDAEDVVQESLTSFVAAYREGRYDRSRGRLGTWFFGFLYRKTLRALEDRGRSSRSSVDTGFFERLPDRAEWFAQWDETWQDELVRVAWRQVGREVAPSTLDAARQFLVENRPAEDVARRLRISRNAVYKAKARVVERMNEIIRQAEDMAGDGRDASD